MHLYIFLEKQFFRNAFISLVISIDYRMGKGTNPPLVDWFVI